MGTASGTASLDVIQAPHDKVGIEGSNEVAGGGAGIIDNLGLSMDVADGRTGSVGGYDSGVEIIVDDGIRILEVIVGYGEPAHIV